MTTAIQNILAWQAAHAGQVTYSETASTRLAYSTAADLLSPTDCSGMAARMFRHFGGVNIGTYTGNECSAGTLISTNKANIRNGVGLLPGDCVLFDWDGGNWDHIAIYAGGGRIWNHGGPGKGPLNWSLANSVDAAVKVMARRFIPHTTSTPDHPDSTDTTEENPLMADKLTPAVIAQIQAAVRPIVAQEVRKQLNLFTRIDSDPAAKPSPGHQIRTVVQDEITAALAKTQVTIHQGAK